ncbi:hypothetical protein EV144_101537 [Flavobacterium sp. 270]|uniref:hypothetical protein n=1 Tax=Flavobacterium sp. 270 TaxID=2512114 RepID=UPI001066A5DA|nr:hypothetical protein [Flavobacterium sp. 270]TDW51859.1 hypothetical protein EV144_101537 [Flavobacterium sp. 270]
MKLIHFFRLLGISKPAGYSNEAEGEIDYHHHDTTDGCESLDETNMHEQPFEEKEDEDYSSIF